MQYKLVTVRDEEVNINPKNIWKFQDTVIEDANIKIFGNILRIIGKERDYKFYYNNYGIEDEDLDEASFEDKSFFGIKYKSRKNWWLMKERKPINIKMTNFKLIHGGVHND